MTFIFSIAMPKQFWIEVLEMNFNRLYYSQIIKKGLEFTYRKIMVVSLKRNNEQ